MKKKYSITIDDDDEVFEVISRKMEILKTIPIGKKTISSKVGKALGIKQRRALEYLDQLEDEGYLTSIREVIQFKSGSRSLSRVFKRVKWYNFFINKLYSDILICTTVYTYFMFVYLTWKNLKGKELKTMLEYKKAEVIIEGMLKRGVEPHLIFESQCSPKPLS